MEPFEEDAVQAGLDEGADFCDGLEGVKFGECLLVKGRYLALPPFV